ncbi:putative Heat shock protein 70 family [Helianthus annuus]|nr:putative Heat shock protein 70 family [Helianthus annuus]
MGRSSINLAIVLIIESEKLGTVIGIDLGTTYSCVGVYKNGHVEIIANDQGNRTIPSWVAFTDNERLIGEASKNQAAVNAERTVFDVKRLIGRKFEDKEAQKDMKLKLAQFEGDALMISMIPADVGKPTSKLDCMLVLIQRVQGTSDQRDIDGICDDGHHDRSLRLNFGNGDV